MIYPFKGTYRLSQGFGKNPQIYKQFGMKGHNGLDWALPNGVEILAAEAGKVIETIDQKNKGYGKYIRLLHFDGSETVYAHLQVFKVKVGDQVSKGQVIGNSNDTGFSTAPHLHFGYRPKGFNYNNGYKGYIDPLPLFSKGETMPTDLKTLFKGMKTHKLPNDPTVYVAIPNPSVWDLINGQRLDEIWFKDCPTIKFKGSDTIYIGIPNVEMWKRLNGGKLDKELDMVERTELEEQQHLAGDEFQLRIKAEAEVKKLEEKNEELEGEITTFESQLKDCEKENKKLSQLKRQSFWEWFIVWVKRILKKDKW